MLLLNYAVWSQATGTVTGIVLDLGQDMEPMGFAEVRVKDGNAVRTDLHGRFTLMSPSVGEHMLVVGFPGYGTQEIPIIVTAETPMALQITLEPLAPEALGPRSRRTIKKPPLGGFVKISIR